MNHLRELSMLLRERVMKDGVSDAAIQEWNTIRQQTSAESVSADVLADVMYAGWLIAFVSKEYERAASLLEEAASSVHFDDIESIWRTNILANLALTEFCSGRITSAIERFRTLLHGATSRVETLMIRSSLLHCCATAPGSSIAPPQLIELIVIASSKTKTRLPRGLAVGEVQFGELFEIVSAGSARPPAV